MRRGIFALAIVPLILASCDLSLGSKSSDSDPSDQNPIEQKPVDQSPVDQIDPGPTDPYQPDPDTAGRDTTTPDTSQYSPPPADVEGISSLDMSTYVLHYRSVNWASTVSGSTTKAETLSVRTITITKSADTTISGRQLERFLVKVVGADTAQTDVGYAFTEATSAGWFLWAYVGETGDAFRKRSVYWIDNVQIELLQQPQQLLKYPLDIGATWQGLSSQKTVASFDSLALAGRNLVCARVHSNGDGSQSPASDQWVVNRAVVRQRLIYPPMSTEAGQVTVHNDLELTKLE